MYHCMNRVTVIGVVSDEIKFITMSNGNEMCNLNLMLTDSYTDKTTGEVKEKKQWIKVSVFYDTLVKYIKEHARKGSTLFVDGKINTRKYSDKDGIEKVITEVIAGDVSCIIEKDKVNINIQKQQNKYANKSTATIIDDEIPF